VTDRRTLMICQAMAQLALLADDADDARRWAHRGLRVDPYSASLALVLARITDDPAVGPPTHAILTAVAEAFPLYPDLQAALIRRDKAEGRDDDARRRLSLWLDRQPDHPLARQVQQELAA
jgi:hypothetical protein